VRGVWRGKSDKGYDISIVRLVYVRRIERSECRKDKRIWGLEVCGGYISGDSRVGMINLVGMEVLAR
jgi:hypothetical protein